MPDETKIEEGIKIYEIDTAFVDMPIARGKTIMRFVSLDDYKNLREIHDKQIADKCYECTAKDYEIMQLKKAVQRLKDKK
jgi:hypothetical protein